MWANASGVAWFANLEGRSSDELRATFCDVLTDAEQRGKVRWRLREEQEAASGLLRVLLRAVAPPGPCADHAPSVT